MRDDPTSQKVGPLSEMDRRLVSLYTRPKKFNRYLLVTARRLLEDFVERRTTSV
jgi:hypothetical protein